MDVAGKEWFPATARFSAGVFIGRGGMGVVFRAFDAEMQQEIALKSLRARDPEQVYRLKEEFRSLTTLAHPNLIDLYELHVDDAACFFTMELIDGTSFVEYVRGERRPGSAEPRRGVVSIDDERLEGALHQLAAGLSYLHAAGRAHRDIKPGNVLVSAADERVVLLDFGLSAPFDPSRSDAPQLAGTLPYMAPEQVWGGPPTIASDWYAAGVLLFEAVTGRLPFTGPPIAVQRGKERGIGSDDGLPARWSPIIRGLLDPDPCKRPGASEILAHLDRPHASSRARAIVPPSSRDLFIGRERELALLDAAFETVGGGRPVVVSISGTSGIGKTALVERFGSTVERRRGALVLRGRCHFQESVPFKAFDAVIDDLSRYLRKLPVEELAALVPAHVASLCRLFSVLGRVDGFSGSDEADAAHEPHELRQRGVDALRDLLTRLAASRPIVLWIDDLQWGDLDSARLLRDLTDPPSPTPILVLLTFRSEDVERSTVLQHLRRHSDGGVERRDVIVTPLPASDAARLAAAILGTDRSGDRMELDHIVRDSNGSPFFLTELAQHLSVRTSAAGSGASRHADVSSLTALRVEALQPPARRLLEIVALAGEPVERSIVLDAAGIGEAGRPLVSLLSKRLLLRATTVDDGPAVEPYHDRIRETVVAGLSPATAREDHQRLALTLEIARPDRPDALARHFHAAGNDDKAAHYAAEAGDQAADALAFERAASLYRNARIWKAVAPARERELRRKEAGALVNAGRSAEAAPLFLSAADSATTQDAIDLRQRAAEQFLASGHVDRGIEVLRRLSKDLGIRYPRSARSALLGTIASLGRIAVSRREIGPISPAVASVETVQVDLCHAAAKGLVPVDTVRGVYFLVLGLALALRSRDPHRIGRGLAVVGGSVLAVGPPLLARWGERMIAQAEAIGRDYQDSYVQALAAGAVAQLALATGAWGRALDHSDRAIALSEQLRGVAFERNIATMTALRALEELGRFGDLAHRARLLMRQAESVGDRYALATGRVYLAWPALAAADVSESRRLARIVVDEWSKSGFYLQHMYALRVEVYADLYEGEPQRALARLSAAWQPMRRSGLLRIPVPRFDAYLMRARCAVACAGIDERSRRAMVRSATRDATRIARECRADARAHASLIRAACAWTTHHPAESLRLLENAARDFATAGMSLQAASVRCRAAVQRGTSAASVRAQHYFGDAGVVREPLRWLAVHAPGFER